MKKVLWILFILLGVFVILTSCSDISSTGPAISAIPSVSNQTTDQNELEKTIEEASMIYHTVEDACLKATDIVIAKYEGKRILNNLFTEYQFSVKDRLLGNAANEISVCIRHTHVTVVGETQNNSYYNTDISLELGREYLLPLYTSPTAYDINPYYLFICGLAIDIEYPLNSVMYGKSNIASHVKGIKWEGITAQSIKNYIQTLTKANTASESIPHAKDLKSLAALSSDVLIVEVGKSLEVITGPYQNSETYYCKVKEILKTDDLKTDEEITVKFFQNSVKEGDTVIVFAQNYGNFFFFVSGKDYINSVQTLDKKAEIITVLQSKE